jgi:glycosyltransferase involved in cell wall biosynthesis
VKNNQKIYYLCPDAKTSYGGTKILYEHVDILNNAGIPAWVLHNKKGFRLKWFENATEVAYVHQTRFYDDDYIVIPEIYAQYFLEDKKKSKKAKIFRDVYRIPCQKIIFNQGCYLTFKGHSLSIPDDKTIYKAEDVIAVMVVSEDSKRYLNYVFPDIKIFRVHNSIDPKSFYYEANKETKICFMPGKNPDEHLQLINILKHRNVLQGWQLNPIEQKSHKEAAEIFRQSLIFINLVYQEGFGLPAAEAMACGCIVIGYPGMGGEEFFRPEFCFPVETGKIIEAAKRVEHVLELIGNDPQCLHDKAVKASEFIRNNYSPDIQKRDVLEFWGTIFQESK